MKLWGFSFIPDNIITFFPHNEDCALFKNKADFVKVVRCSECKYKDDCAGQMVHTTRDYVLEQNISSYNKVSYCSYGASVTDTNVGGKWIPCSERLPDIKEGKYASDCVLVTLKWWDGEISETVGWYNRTGTWSEGGKMCKVIAWMPYEPYKGE